MTEAALAPLQRAQQLAGGAATAAVVGAVLITLAAVAQGASPALDALSREVLTFDVRSIARVITLLAIFWVVALPNFLLAGSLLDLSKVLEEYGKGQFFTLKASAGVRKAAEGALWALGFKVVGSPTIYSWLTNEARGFEYHVETFDYGLFAFAGVVMVIGRVLEAAARIKEENDEIV